MQRVRISSHQSPVHKLGDSQMTLSPKFKLAPARGPSLPDPTLETHDPLIPGLPDDVALQCLLRVAVDQHASCRPVSRRWFSLFGSKERFFTLRKELGFHDPWLFVFAYSKCTRKIEWKVLDLTRLSWHSIPSMPCKDKVCPQGFRCVSIPKDGALYVFGGVVSDVDCPLNLVLKYEARKNKWTVMKKMITARSYFASGVIDGMIYVAGGNSTDLYELNSAEVLDPVNGLWRPVSNMSVVIDGRLFVVTEHERTKVKVYDSGSDSWESVDGPVLPEEICKPFKVGSWGWEIYVVGRNLHVAVGRVERAGSRGFRIEWRVVDAPGSLFDLTPASAQVLFA
ncbi:F-box/kelch-repeat protein [Striga hermonthica]|uniref:F-box/kelch-repeat protein n=1 Tax=Striga hermonthica TaxID=68872 RepID=A0A9N7NEL1_STRHE|nr:F-box/kelch-repeat protein [Striga hermonthica]